MGNKKNSREFMKQREDVVAQMRAQTEERELTADVHLRGIGVRRIQLIERPTFSEGSSWDVRQLGDDWSCIAAQFQSPSRECWAMTSKKLNRKSFNDTLRSSAQLICRFDQTSVAQAG